MPLFVVVVALAVRQYFDQRRQVIEAMAAESATYAISLNTVAKLARDHVLQMQSWSSEYLGRPAAAPHRWRSLFEPRLANGQPDGYTIANPPPEVRKLVGQVFWLAGDPRDPAVGRGAIEHVFGLFDIARLTHEQTQYFQWSYFFAAPDRRHTALFPWVASKDAIEGAGQASLHAATAGWLEYEIAKKARPQENPGRELYWTAPYLDAAGAGAMVSIGAPVYVGDRFEGSVGTDLTLQTLESFVRGFSRPLGRLWVLDDKDMVLVDTSGSPRDKLRSFADLGLPAATREALAQARGTPGLPVSAGGHTMIARTTASAPWTLIYDASEAEIRAMLLPRFIPYGVILAVLGINFMIALFLLRRELIAMTDTVHVTLAANRVAAEQLRESEAFKSAIVDNAMLAVVTLDERGQVVEFNRAAEMMFRYRREEVLGRDAADLMVPARQRSAYRERMSRWGNGEPDLPMRRHEFTAMRSDGSLLPVEASVSAIAVGERRFFTAFVADLTQVKQAEQELARQRDVARQNEKLVAMGGLLAGLAHELNNPMAILMGRAELLEQKVTDPAIRSDALKVFTAATRCGRIVRMFLSMARHQPARRQRGDIADVVAGVIDLLGYGLQSAGIEMVQKLRTDLPSVEMDADRISQIVINLLVNAQQALAAHGGPRRIVVSSRELADGIALRVADNGPGIAAAARERIFESFYTTKPEGIGTGLGLSVSRALAREHGGELLLLDSEEGACFELQLPLVAAALDQSPAEPRTLAEPQSVAGTALVVDDEPEVAQLLCDILRSAGFAAECVCSARDAWQWLATNACSFVLSDLRLPDTDGLELWRELRLRDPGLAERLGFVTGDILSGDMAPLLRETGRPSVEKPFTRDDILSLVADLIGRRE